MLLKNENLCLPAEIDVQAMIMIESDGFFDLAGLEAFHADTDPHGCAVNDSPDSLKVGHKAPYIDTGDL